MSRQNDSISREWLEDSFDNLCCHNCKICRNFRIEDSFYKCALIDNAPTVEQDALITEIIEELESRKDYGAEYAQAMEDVIVILKAKFGLGEEE